MAQRSTSRLKYSLLFLLSLDDVLKSLLVAQPVLNELKMALTCRGQLSVGVRIRSGS